MSYLTSAVVLFILTCVFHTHETKARKPAGCKLPAETGPCKASFKAWHYDSKERKCKPFIYGGCGGNGNNFETKGKCESRCGWKYSEKTDKCFLRPKEEKSCPNSSAVTATRWYYSQNAEKCKQRIFRSCSRNPSGFATCTDCLNRCRHHMLVLQVCADANDPK
ncbi:BPTI/Kunitz domain-containing protein-like [Rhipicephalus microplus]|uniref:BPTI/Kunitz domain-containing protein-like n=1 Tax=Rhipicephalus microplus TaxID=6941 RepID=UPI003F6BA7E9